MALIINTSVVLQGHIYSKVHFVWRAIKKNHVIWYLPSKLENPVIIIMIIILTITKISNNNTNILC